MKLNINDLQFIIYETTKKLQLDEGIGIDKFPKYGYCLIMAGGPGSGKSTLLKNELQIDGKVFSIDDFTEKYKKLPNVTKNDLERKNISPKFIETQKTFLSAQGNVKNNVIFDICGAGKGRGQVWSTIEDVIALVQPYGYKIGIIWVVTNRSVAMKRNIQRDRTVSDAPFHQKTNKANAFLPFFLTNARANVIDDAWVVFSSGSNINDNEIPKTVRLEKTESGFDIPNDLMQQIQNVLGPQEQETFKKPVTYLSNSEVKKLTTQPDNFLRNDN